MSSETQEFECARLREFQEFLREQKDVNVVSVTGAGGAEMRNCMTRNNNETYPVTIEELHAEIIVAVWQQLQVKRCPRNFQLPLLRAVVTDVEQECHNAKECDFACATTNSTSMAGFEIQYDLVKLQKFVVNNLEKLLTRLADNAELANLKNYVEEKSLCSGEKCNCSTTLNSDPAHQPSYTFGSAKNKPRKMEDRYICLERFSDLYQLKRPYSFYGVFDGHSGSLAASYTSTQLPNLLAERLRVMKTDDFDDVTNTINDYRDAFEAAFLQADEMFTQKHISSGTTAVCALLQHRTSTTAPSSTHLYVAWVGDSKALLVSPAASLQLVKSHKPDSMDERKRIESAEAGGAVMFVQGHWRVNGILNVSRSIGDYSVRAVIAEPDFVDVPLTDSHDFLVLGTDGLWDHVTESSIIECIYNALCDINQSIEDIPKQLIEMAKQGDSQDNITVVIVLLKERCRIVENYKNE